ncbi:BON domain-containing protein [Aeromicrobium sp.]|uniref:BON domain-containing protein n=1 Tax=Aeromicrobium sp. TaxID=1871063 RepID=UPI002FC994C6
MNTSTTKTRDMELQDRVEQSLEWAPEVESAKIGVSVHDGVVTLHGEVPSYWQKTMASKIALKTRGVSAIADDIVVHHITDPRTDSDIALAANNLIKWNSDVPEESVKIKVQDHVLTLTGEVSWNFEREAAFRSVKHLGGVRDVRNRITLKRRPQANAADTEVLIRRAIMRHASLDASRVHASVDGTRVILTGTVSSHAEKMAAASAAWASPHVDHVENRITVDV